MTLKKLLLVLCCLLPVTGIWGQNKEVFSTDEDSALVGIRHLLEESERMRFRDSLRAVILHEELLSIKNDNGPAVQELQQELSRLRAADSIHLQQQKEAVRALQENTKGSPVFLYNDTLFLIYASLGPFNGAHRARDAREKIEKLYKAGVFYPDSLRISNQQGLYNIFYEDVIITSVSLTDALWLNQQQDSLAFRYLAEIRDKIGLYRETNSFQHTMARVGYAVLVIAVLWAVLWLFQLLFRRIRFWILKQRQKLPGLKVRNYQLLSPQYMIQGITQLLRMSKTALTVLAIYLGLSVVFSIFPYTYNWANILLGWVWRPIREAGAAVIDYLPDLFTVLVILFLARMIKRIFLFFSNEIEQGALHIKGFHREWARPTYTIVRFFVYAFAFVLIFPYLPGSDSLAFKGVSVFLGIVFSLGSSSAVSNTIAGMVITYMRPFKIGDWIRVNDITGYVVEKSALVTRVRTIVNEDVTIPNAAILSGMTVNYSSSGRELGLVVSVEITVSYDTSWETVQALLIKAAKETKDINHMQSPFVFQKKLNEFYVTYELNAYTNRPERMYHIRSELYQHTLTVFKEAGIALISSHAIRIMRSDDKEGTEHSRRDM